MSAATGVPIVCQTLTVEERRKRTAKGLCFNCVEQYKPGHKCQEKLFRLGVEQNCLVEVLDFVAEDAKVEGVGGEIEISMHVLSGSINSRTIQLVGSIKGQQLSILIDRGSTHNFVQCWVFRFKHY